MSFVKFNLSKNGKKFCLQNFCVQSKVMNKSYLSASSLRGGGKIWVQTHWGGGGILLQALQNTPLVYPIL